MTEGVIGNAETVRAMGMMPEMSRRWSAIRVQAIAMQADASKINSSVSSVIEVPALRVAGADHGDRRMAGGQPRNQPRLAVRGVAHLHPRSDARRPAWSASGARSFRLGPRSGGSKISWRSRCGRLPCRFRRRRGGSWRRDSPILYPARKPSTLSELTFSVDPGESLGIVGPSAAGKSTLARIIVGAIKPTAGSIRLDGAEICPGPGPSSDASPATCRRISNSSKAPSRRISAASGKRIPRRSLRLPSSPACTTSFSRSLKGYNTPLQPNGAPLSGGQRQRIALARAVFGNPRLVVLDEPNSNLDGEGEAALHKLVAALKASRTTVILIAHRPSVLVSLDKVLVLTNGTVAECGPVERVMPRIAPGPCWTKAHCGERMKQALAKLEL